MSQHLDQTFEEIVTNIEAKLESYAKEDQKTMLNMLEETSKNVWSDDDKRRRNDRARHLLYMVESGEKPLQKDSKSEFERSRKHHTNIGPSTSKIPSLGKSFLEKLEPTMDMNGISDVIDRVNKNEITTTAEFIFNIIPYVEDRGVALQEMLEKNLQVFREVVEDTIDRRIQDECDVMMHTQNDVKQKLRALTKAMERRVKKIKKRLLEISPDFDWSNDGKDREKILKFIIKQRPDIKEPTDETERLVHQVFMRGQWLKKELSRLQDENTNLKVYLDKFRYLAEERKAQEAYVPRMLQKEKKNLEKELNKQRKRYKRNMEIINDLYIDFQTYANPENNFMDRRHEDRQ